MTDAVIISLVIGPATLLIALASIIYRAGSKFTKLEILLEERLGPLADANNRLMRLETEMEAVMKHVSKISSEMTPAPQMTGRYR